MDVKLAVSVIVYACDRLHESVLRVLGRPRPMRWVILYYHSVTRADREGFRRQMDTILREARPVRLSAGNDILTAPFCVSVTFDDVFEDVVTNAVPILTELEIPCTLFVTAGFLGRSASWWPGEESARPIVSAEQLAGLRGDLIEIGSHTVTHPMLVKLPEAEVWWELMESKQILSGLLGRSVDTISMPYGAHNERIIEQCMEAGYKRVYTSSPRLADPSGSADVGRVPVEPGDSLLSFRLKIRGAYRWLPTAIFWKRRLRRMLGLGCGTQDMRGGEAAVGRHTRSGER